MRVEGQARPVEKFSDHGDEISVLPPVSALAEIVILFALIYGAEQATPNLSVLDLSPHPFWIPVLLVSLQYGTISGFIAAAAAIGLSLFAGFPEQDIGENLFVYFVRVFGQPILWISVALLVGQFRMRQLGAKQELRIANRALGVQRDDLAHHAQQLRGRVERLEQELATRYGAPPHAGAAVLAQTMAVGGFIEEASRQSTLQHAAVGLFPEAVITAYRVREGALTEFAVCGRSLQSGPRMRIPAEAPLYRNVIGKGRAVSILDAAGEDILAGTGLAAVPIPAAACDLSLASATDEAFDAAAEPPTAPGRLLPFGILVIEQARPDTITPEGILALELLAHALSPRPPRPMLRPESGARRVLRRAHRRVETGLNEAARIALPARMAQGLGGGLLMRLSKASGSASDALGDVHADVSITEPGVANAPATFHDEDRAKSTDDGKASGKT